MIGSPAVHYLLDAYDEDFQKLFKVKADFATWMPRNPESEQAYARCVNTIAQQRSTIHRRWRGSLSMAHARWPITASF